MGVGNADTLRDSELWETLLQDKVKLAEALTQLHNEDVAQLLREVSISECLQVLKTLDVERAARVVARMRGDWPGQVFSKLSLEDAAELFSHMSADDRADIIQDLDFEFAEEILAKVSLSEPEAAEEARELAAYPEESAGGLMTTEFIALAPEISVADAIGQVRLVSQGSDPEYIYYIYVVGYGNKLLGVVSLRDLILANPNTALGKVMTEKIFSVVPCADQEEVAREIAKYDLAAIPVVDPQQGLLGVVTVDDVVDVVIEEATEDAQRLGAVQPISNPYFQTSVGTLFRKRAPWLVVLFAGELLTANVLHAFEADLAATMALVTFIPLIISSGGNSGAQSSSIIIRALAVGEIRPQDWVRIFSREALLGIALGLLLGVIGLLRASLTGNLNQSVAISVALSIVAIVFLGTLLGSLLPLLIQRVGLDPAVSSTPLIASLVDVVGLLLYCTIAGVVIGLVF